MASLPQPPQTPRHHISRDQRIIARTLRSQGHTYAQIAQQLHITQRQVQKACTDDRPTPRKAPGASSRGLPGRLERRGRFFRLSTEAPSSGLAAEFSSSISVSWVNGFVCFFMARVQGGVFEGNSVSVDWAGELGRSEKSHGKRHSHEYMVLRRSTSMKMLAWYFRSWHITNILPFSLYRRM